MVEFVAFYGSLRYPSTRDGLGISQQIQFVTNALIPGYMVDLGHFPGLIEGDGEVFADVYQILDPKALERLDGFEGYMKGDPDNSMYIRKKVDFLLFKDFALAPEGWAYYYNHPVPNHTPIDIGDWVQYVAAESKDYYLGASGQ